MVRHTQKYVAALEIAALLNVVPPPSSEELYAVLTQARYYWDAKTQSWVFVTEPSQPPTEFVRLRVWASEQVVQLEADKLILAIERTLGWQCIERSAVYPCRPPKEKEARVYLLFDPMYE
jgi:hypothetical protein